ncbi:hypothetical protein HanRHA438_Chr11g0501181 [Helianthus annuus]|uniref:Uncharacterized protein n=1 Tax=Helianthus annuus TaxID=4232 RepID=A0A251T8F5_HELAN|nr:hypothetical protein HanXRQr2_Chr11g0488341 [Helianthus annuus]KAJ0501373.1 hypothetical protein HanHA300_Chr11g0400071 [Helianthus annuus]KAJ0509165.1 hypothetical protein HanIR_Chr11g0525721 [Helianthus annuus]KAJ0517279.1 hypothetical protein HanHA89_Chr11g0423571 [Helianthus annuus]KAJ0685291.1 hypothetical protein HanLR1_Chr11g0401031 [Helianthus annuus]
MQTQRIKHTDPQHPPLFEQQDGPPPLLGGGERRRWGQTTKKDRRRERAGKVRETSERWRRRKSPAGHTHGRHGLSTMISRRFEHEMETETREKQRKKTESARC